METFGPLTTALGILFSFWWIYTPVLLFLGVKLGYLTYISTKYLNSLKWVLLEVKPPPEVFKSPKAAEYIFINLHALAGSVSWKKKWFTGKVPDWFSFEIVSSGGEPHFYVRTLEGYRNLVEAQFFAQYPLTEINLVDEDYVAGMPEFLPNNDYNLFGTELLLAKPSVFPIQTHPTFEEVKGGKEEESKRTDPLASIFEILSALESNEHIWIQLLARPVGDGWVKAAKEEIDTLMGKPKQVKESGLSKLVGGIDDLIRGGAGEEKKEQKDPSLSNVTPGVRKVIEAIEEKTAKLGYEAGIRFMYIGPNDKFNRANVAGIFGLFKQLSAPSLNSFKPNGKTTTGSKGWMSWLFPSEKGFFADSEEFKRKWKLYFAYKSRKFPKEFMVLNTEEMATIFHLPGTGVRAPLFPRVESKKGIPPQGLPIG